MVAADDTTPDVATLSLQATLAQHMYDARATNYDNSFHPNFAQRIVDSLDLRPGEHVLDLACGTGLVTLTAAKAVGPTGKVVGVDITDGMLAELRRKIDASPSEYTHVTIYKHDITQLESLQALEVMKGTFDAVSLASALVLLREPGMALHSWLEYLKPGGRLITDATDTHNFPSSIAFERVYARLNLQFPSNRLWSVDGNSLRRLLLQAGYDVQKEDVWFEKSTGAETKYHPIEAWETQFNDFIYTPPLKALVDAGNVDEARPLFREEWEKLAIHERDGKMMVKETDGVHVVLARKPLSVKSVMARGSCACATIKWSTTAETAGDSSNCFCTTCRKISGSPFQTFFEVPTHLLTLDPPFGKPLLKTFKKSEQAERTFCSECGSTISMAYLAQPESVWIAAGTLDEEASEEGWYAGPENHIFTQEKPKWFKLPEDGLPRNANMNWEHVGGEGSSKE